MGKAVGINRQSVGKNQSGVLPLQAGQGGVTSFTVQPAQIKVVAFDIEVQPGKFVLVDNPLVGGLQPGWISNDIGEFLAGFAAEGHDHVAVAFADGINLVTVKVLCDGNAAIPRGLRVMDGFFAIMQSVAQ